MPARRVRAGGRAVGAMRSACAAGRVAEPARAALGATRSSAEQKHGWLADVAARGSAPGSPWRRSAWPIAGAVAWWPDAAASASVATAVLIVACPCALTLSAPITLGTAMGVLGRRGLYLKQPAVALDLSRIDTVVFDKTGTLTAGGDRTVVERHGLSDRGWALVRRLALESVHPVSRAIARATESMRPRRSDSSPRPPTCARSPARA